jgi:hypothetical protein
MYSAAINIQEITNGIYRYVEMKQSNIEAAARAGNVATVKHLLETANIEDIKEALWSAVEHGHIEVVKCLMTYIGGQCDADLVCALQISINHGHLGIVRFLVEECGANIGALANWALVDAAANDYMDVIEYIVESGVSADVVNYTLEICMEADEAEDEMTEYLRGKGGVDDLGLIKGDRKAVFVV